MIALSLFLIACEDDLYQESQQTIVAKSSISQKYVTINEVPEIISAIKQFNPAYSYLNTGQESAPLGRGIEDFNLNLEKILELTYGSGQKSYSLIIEKEFQEWEDRYFENLNISLKGETIEMKVFRYNSIDDSKSFDLKTFTGRLEVLDIDYNVHTIIDIENGSKVCDKAIIIGCSHYYFGENGNMLFYYDLCPGSGSDGPTDNTDGGMGSDTGSNNGYSNTGNNGSSSNNGNPNPVTGNDPTAVDHTPVAPNTLTALWPDFPNRVELADLVAELLSLNGVSKNWLESDATNTQAQNIYDFLLYSNVNNSEVITLAQTLIGEMIANPNLVLDGFASAKSPANIDLSKVTPNLNNPSELNHQAKVKFICVYNKLMESPDFKKLFTDMFQENIRPNVRFEIVNLLGDAQGGTVGTTVPDSNDPYNININIDVDLLNNGNTMAILKTILHECIHAFLDIKLLNSNIGISIPELINTEVKDCINQYYNGFNGLQNQHDFIYNYFIPVMKNILSQTKNLLISSQQNAIIEDLTLHINQNTDPIINVSEPWNWNDFYQNLSLDGLQNCSFFASEIATYNNGTYTNIVDQNKTSKFIQYKIVSYSNLPNNCN
jgi:hypothetical protein